MSVTIGLVEAVSLTVLPSYRQYPDLEPTGLLDSESGLKNYKLLRSVTLSIRVNGTLYIFTVPEGYITDLASVPKFATKLFGTELLDPADPETALAAVIHDWLYSTNGLSHPAPGFETFVSLDPSCALLPPLSKEACDKILTVLMEANDAAWVRGELYFIAVHFFGDSAWNGPHPAQ